MGKMEELGDLKIVCMDIDDLQKRNEMIEKIDNLKKEIAKECEDAIKHLTELLNNCSNAIKGSYLNFETSLLTQMLKNIINRLQELDPQNILFQKK